jgi:hypothetical protein
MAKTDKEKVHDHLKKVKELVDKNKLKLTLKTEDAGACEPGCIEIVIGGQKICVC